MVKWGKWVRASVALTAFVMVAGLPTPGAAQKIADLFGRPGADRSQGENRAGEQTDGSRRPDPSGPGGARRSQTEFHLTAGTSSRPSRSMRARRPTSRARSRKRLLRRPSVYRSGAKAERAAGEESVSGLACAKKEVDQEIDFKKGKKTVTSTVWASDRLDLPLRVKTPEGEVIELRNIKEGKPDAAAVRGPERLQEGGRAERCAAERPVPG